MLRFAANLAMLFGEHALPDRFRVSRDFGFQLVEMLNTHESPGYFLPGSEAAAGLIRE